jgi:hypothetical protein
MRADHPRELGGLRENVAPFAYGDAGAAPSPRETHQLAPRPRLPTVPGPGDPTLVMVHTQQPQRAVTRDSQASVGGQRGEVPDGGCRDVEGSRVFRPARQHDQVVGGPDRSVARSPLDPRAVWPHHEPAIRVQARVPEDVSLQGKPGDGHPQHAVAGRSRQRKGGAVAVEITEDIDSLTPPPCPVAVPRPPGHELTGRRHQRLPHVVMRVGEHTLDRGRRGRLGRQSHRRTLGWRLHRGAG